MIVTHARLIRADETTGQVTHHCGMNGQVHDGHPRFCDNVACRRWGAELLERDSLADAERIRSINAELRGDNDPGMAVVAWTVIGAAFAFSALAAWWIVRHL